MPRRRTPAPFGGYYLICPYCEAQNMQKITNDFNYLICPSCNKEFRVFLTKVRAKRGRKYGIEREYIIRYIAHSGEGVVEFIDRGGSDLDIRSSDIIYLSYEKNKEGTYNDYPSILSNVTTKRYVKIPRPKKGCFIATVTCGYDSWEVKTLSLFRDKVLSRKWIGKYYITIYYKISPFLVSIIANKDKLKQIIRKTFVSPIAKLISGLYSWITIA